MKKILLLAMIAGLSLPAVSQVSPFLEKGKSGITIGAGAEQGYTLKGGMGKIGGSIKGIVDIEASYYYDKYDKSAVGLLNTNASSSGVVATATWWVLRKQPVQNIEVNFGLLAGYQNFSFSDYKMLLSTNDIYESKGYSEGIAGFDTRINFQLSDGWNLMPGYSLLYNFGQQTQKIADVEETGNSTGLVSKLNVSLFKRLSKGDAVSFTFNQYFDTYSTGTYFQLAIGYVLPLK